MMIVFQKRSYDSDRGKLIPVEFTSLPFVPVRMFFIHSVPEGQGRGDHAHRECSQILIPLSGKFTIESESAQGKETFITSNHVMGVFYYALPYTWLKLKDFSKDASVLVLCSHPYDFKDYINDYQEFKATLQKHSLQ